MEGSCDVRRRGQSFDGSSVVRSARDDSVGGGGGDDRGSPSAAIADGNNNGEYDRDYSYMDNNTNSSERYGGKIYLLISNPKPTNHLGTILRCAAAYKVHEVILVGCAKYNSEGSHGSTKHLNVRVLHSWESAVNYLRRPDDGSYNDDRDEEYNDSNCADVDNGTDRCGVTDGEANGVEDPTCKRRRKKIRRGQRPPRVESILGLTGAVGGEGAYSSNGLATRLVAETGFVSVAALRSIGKDNDDDSDYPQSLPVHLRPFPKTYLSIDNHDGENDNDGVNGDSGSDGGPSVPASEVIEKAKNRSKAHPGSVCFLVSKDRRGLPVEQARLCDGFVHVPHVGIIPMPTFQESIGDSPSAVSSSVAIQAVNPVVSSFLDAPTYLSIALHHYAAWAKYGERDVDGAKFIVDRSVVKGRQNPNQMSRRRFADGVNGRRVDPGRAKKASRTGTLEDGGLDDGRYGTWESLFGA